ncbi:MAG: homoserine kinase [Rothia sp. (in: high G+C Gram-positive bacteria)]|uniref:homoserine kinase n=1 Tax=Rothia sp. (in: high G+C Gram-positive bacteria) TaxID=1885016 RepID=UPI0026E0D298|nr:homoserine kinase [Rothia sp. (in: high G+C Gram-positive bacteria)]MDO5750763.1 homoserine kinase [Rothia sp. (in: high G+C Gram-positive bacteria)]
MYSPASAVPLIVPADIPVGARVTVRVPASSANLGPGYDSMGLALGFYDELSVERIESGLEFVLSGEGSEDVPRDASHLVVRSMAAAFAAAGLQVLPGLRLTAHNRIPHSRGMGSSASAIVAGVFAANELLPFEFRLSREQLLQVASDMEGHPDNVAPSLFGNASVSWGQPGAWRSANVPVHPSIIPVVAVPDYEVSTKQARSLIPASVPHEEAAANSARAALLVRALSHAPHFLMEATVDYLHQGYRVPAMMPSAALVAFLREEEIPAVISGAGPTVLAFARSRDEIEVIREAIEEFEAHDPQSVDGERRLSWRVMPLEIDTEGVTLV